MLARFLYDGDGKRTRQVIPTSTTQSYSITYVGPHYSRAISSEEITRYIYVDLGLGPRLLAIRRTCPPPHPVNLFDFYMHTDHLGSVVKMTDDTGSDQSLIRYRAYGEFRELGPAIENPPDIQFAGQRHDWTRLYHYGSRYYHPGLGRFIQPDSVVPDYNNPQSLNRYSYALNNPMKYTDPSGHRPILEGDDTNDNDGDTGPDGDSGGDTGSVCWAPGTVGPFLPYQPPLGPYGPFLIPTYVPDRSTPDKPSGPVMRPWTQEDERWAVLDEDNQLEYRNPDMLTVSLTTPPLPVLAPNTLQVALDFHGHAYIGSGYAAPAKFGASLTASYLRQPSPLANEIIAYNEGLSVNANAGYYGMTTGVTYSPSSQSTPWAWNIGVGTPGVGVSVVNSRRLW